jgi:hypothetical protein
MVKKLKFVKLAGQWFVHLPNYPGNPEDLAMVSGADILCDMIDSEGFGEITVLMSTEPQDNPAWRGRILDFSEFTGDEGALYTLRDIKLNVWLCNVTKYVFGEFPKTIYIY